MKKLFILVVFLCGCTNGIIIKNYAGKVKIVSGKFISTDLNNDYWADRNFKAKKGDSVWIVTKNDSLKTISIKNKTYILK